MLYSRNYEKIGHICKRNYPKPSDPITTTPTHHHTEITLTQFTPNLDSVELEHNCVRIDRVIDFIYKAPFSTIIHLMEDTQYFLYIDKERMTLLRNGTVPIYNELENYLQERKNYLL